MLSDSEIKLSSLASEAGENDQTTTRADADAPAAGPGAEPAEPGAGGTTAGDTTEPASATSEFSAFKFLNLKPYPRSLRRTIEPFDSSLKDINCKLAIVDCKPPKRIKS